MMGTITITVEQREPANMTQKEESAGNMEVVPPEETDKGHVENGQKEAEEANEEMSVLEEKVEDLEQTSEPQSNEVGFKKVFKFVGFKFTMKKEKTEKSEPVQLLTVKKDEVEANGTHEHDEVKSDMPEEDKPNDDMTDFADKTDKARDSTTDLLPEKTDEATNEQAENTDDVEQKEPEKSEPEKLPESPSNPTVNETSSSFKKFFAQGWAGLRKKTSFKKPKEEEHHAAMKNENEEPEEKKEMDDILIEAVEGKEVVAEKERPSGEEPLPQEAPESVHKDSIVSLNEKQTEECKIIEKIEVSTTEKLEPGEEYNVLHAVTERLTEQKVEQDEEKKVTSAMITETSAGTLDQKEMEILVSSDEVREKDHVTVGSLNFEQSSEIVPKEQETEPSNEVQEAKEMSDSAAEGQIQQIESSPEHTSAHKTLEGIPNEADLLSSQDKIKLQGSPLKKLFTGSGLKRLSGKKQKGKKEEDSKVEETAEHMHLSSEPSEGQVADKGESSPSSPEESTEVSSGEKTLVDEAQTGETEGEGTTSDGEKKKDGITTWASFKKLVTPKKRVKRPSESDKEDEPEKTKSATMSSTESAASVENQEENKINGEEQKPEKSTEETKRKVDSSVSWEALICVGSSKKRGKKSSESDEEEAQKPLDDSQKTDDDTIKSKETEAPLAVAQDINQAQGNSSPEQAGSPSEGEGVSTWESFKRLVTSRKKSKPKMEDKIEESAVALNAEHSTSDGEPGKEESWVSFKKLIPGRKKKKSDGKQEYASAERVVQEAAGAEAAEEDSDVPAVVPLSEYEAAEQEKTEALQTVEAVAINREISAQDHSAKKDVIVEEPSEGLMHAVTVTLVEGARAVTSIEERSPSWISATVTESIEQENECEEIQQTRHSIETKIIVEETTVVTKTVPQTTKEISEDPLTTETEITHEAVTALEEATEMSFAEETTEMVSAVSQLSESPVTTEETTPVQEEEESQKSLEDMKKQTQKVLQGAAEKVRLSEEALMETEVKDEQSEVNTVQSPVFIECSEQKEVKEAEVKQVESSSRSTEGIKEVEESVSEGESKMIVETYCLTEKCVPEVGNYEANLEGTILCEKQTDLLEEAIRHQNAGKEETEKILKVEKEQDAEENNLQSTTTVITTVESQPEVKMDIEKVKQQQEIAVQKDQPKVNVVAQSESTEDGCLVVGSKNTSIVHEAKSEFTKDLTELAESLSSLKSKPIEETQDNVSVKTETTQKQVSLVCSKEDVIIEKFEEETCQQEKRTEQLEPLAQDTQLMTENSGTEEIKQEPTEPVKSLQEMEQAQKSDVMREPEEIKDGECEEAPAILQCADTIKEGKVEEELYQAPADQAFLDVQQEAGLATVLKEQVIRKSDISEDLCGREISDAYSVPVQEEVTDKQEHADITKVIDIPKVESTKARRASVPVTAAATEERVVTERVALIQTSVETVSLDVDVQADDQVAESEEPVLESMSQAAFVIVDAVIEAAAISLSDVEPDNNTLAQKHKESAKKDVELQEEQKQSQVEVEMQKNESSFTVVQKIIPTAVQEVEEKTEETIYTDISNVPHDSKTASEFQETVQMDEPAVVKQVEETLIGEEEEVHQTNAISCIVVEKISEDQSSVEHTKDKSILDISEENGVTFQEQKFMPQTQVGEQVHEDVIQVTKEEGDIPKREQKEEPLQQEAKSNLASESEAEEVTSETITDRKHMADTGISKEESREFQDLTEESLNVKDVDQVVETQGQLSQQVEERKQVLSETEAKIDVLHTVHSQEDESLGRTKEQSQSTES